jgi:hypothetical protein
MSIEAMKQALEALLFFNEAGLGTIGSNEAITSLRQAIAEAEKQPQRQPLTDDDCEEVERWVEFKEEGSDRIPTGKLIRYIEAKLREKNGG